MLAPEGLAPTIVAGMAAGIAKSCVSHPFNVYKARAQAGRPSPRPRDLLRGLPLSLGKNGVEHMLHMGLRDIVGGGLVAAGVEAPSSFVVGFLAGVPQAILMCPLEFALTRAQLGQPIVWAQAGRGIGWMLAKEMTSGAIFFGLYERGKRDGMPPGAAGATAALGAMVSSYPLDTWKTRRQAVAVGARLEVFGGLRWALAKCIVSNWAALSVYEKARGSLVHAFAGA